MPNASSRAVGQVDVGALVQPAQLVLVDPPGQVDPVQSGGCAGSAPSPALRALADDRRAQRPTDGSSRRGRRAARPAWPAGACATPAASRRRRAPDAGCPRRRASVTGRHHAASTPLGTTSHGRVARGRRTPGPPPSLDTALRATPRSRPARQVSQRPEHAGRAVDDAVEGGGHGQPGVERHRHEVGGERAHHAEVRVRDVEPAGVEPTAHLRRRERVHRDAARQPDREPVHRDTVVAGRRCGHRARRAARRSP